MRVALPQRVRAILQSPDDEKDWGKLQAVRDAIASEIQGEKEYCFDLVQIEAVAAGIERCTSTKFYDEVAKCECRAGENCRCLPDGARVLVAPSSLRGKIPTIRRKVATAICELTDQTIVRVLLRGYKTERSPPLDDMA